MCGLTVQCILHCRASTLTRASKANIAFVQEIPSELESAGRCSISSDRFYSTCPRKVLSKLQSRPSELRGYAPRLRHCDADSPDVQGCARTQRPRKRLAASCCSTQQMREIRSICELRGCSQVQLRWSERVLMPMTATQADLLSWGWQICLDRFRSLTPSSHSAAGRERKVSAEASKASYQSGCTSEGPHAVRRPSPADRLRVQVVPLEQHTAVTCVCA